MFGETIKEHRGRGVFMYPDKHGAIWDKYEVMCNKQPGFIGTKGVNISVWSLEILQDLPGICKISEAKRGEKGKKEKERERERKRLCGENMTRNSTDTLLCGYMGSVVAGRLSSRSWSSVPCPVLQTPVPAVQRAHRAGPGVVSTTGLLWALCSLSQTEAALAVCVHQWTESGQSMSLRGVHAHLHRRLWMQSLIWFWPGSACTLPGSASPRLADG